jgi:hypothetical protein
MAEKGGTRRDEVFFGILQPFILTFRCFFGTCRNNILALLVGSCSFLSHGGCHLPSSSFDAGLRSSWNISYLLFRCLGLNLCHRSQKQRKSLKSCNKQKKAEKIQNPAGKGRHVTIIIIIIIIIPRTNFFLSAGAERRRRRRSRGRWERRRLPQPKKRKENQLKIFL